MPSIGLPIVGTVALAIGLLAIYLQSLNDLLFEKGIKYGHSIFSSPFALDTNRDIKYIGRYSASGIEHYHSIFYAHAPTGHRRFAPPVPYVPTAGSVVDATQPGAWCPQGTGDILPFTSRVTNVSENCLSLRIARSRGVKPGAKLPVIVWIHGGGHALGSGEEVLYHPDGVLKQAKVDNQPIIYVAINYRLGIFGFATSRELLKLGHTNAGLRDQRAAIEWVRDNIEAFGGDSNKVTVIGQSVGASDIGLHLTSFNGEQGVPFQQAVMMSGAPGLNFNTKSDLVANNTASVAMEIGCTDKDNDQSQEVLECLREASVDALTNASVAMSRAARPPFGEGFFHPTYDSDFLQDRPTELMRAGKFVRGVPIIASFVTNDGAWYAPPTISSDEEVLASFGRWLFGLSEATKQRLLEFYPLAEFEHMVRPSYDGKISAQYYRAAQINRDLWFTCPVVDFAWQYVKRGGIRPEQIRLYEFNSTRFTPVYEMMGVPMWRVAHLSDIPYVLNVQKLGGGCDNSADQLALAKHVSQAIVRFVIHGSPEGNPRIENWPDAFSGMANQDFGKENPEELSFHIFGGPHGFNPVKTGANLDGSALDDIESSVEWERVLERCAYINSAQVRAEAGI